MAYNTLACGSNQSNTGDKQCVENFQIIEKFVITSDSFEFATQAAAETLANWTTGINAAAGSRIYPFPQILEQEDISEETQYQTFTTGKQKKIREGKRGYRFLVQVPLCVHQALRTFNGGNWRIILIDSNGRVIGTSPNGAKFKGFKVVTFEVEKMKIPAGDATVSTPIMVMLQDTTEFDDFGASFRPADLTVSWNALDLDGLQDVILTESVTDACDASGGTIDVSTTCDGVPVTGLVTGDWVLVDDAAGAETVTGCTDNADGTYTLTWTVAADGYILTLKQPVSMTTKGYDVSNTITFTIAP